MESDEDILDTAGAGGMYGAGMDGGTTSTGATALGLGGLEDVGLGMDGTSVGVATLATETGGAGSASGVGRLIRPVAGGSESTKLDRDETLVLVDFVEFPTASLVGKDNWASLPLFVAASRAALSFLCAVVYISSNRSCIAETRLAGTRQTMIHPSPPTETIYLPSGENLMPVIASECPMISAMTSPEKKSNMRIFRSREHVAINIPKQTIPN
jgi:hypothetical protein